MIYITPHEFKMLQQDYHPDYTFKYEEDEDSLGIIEEEGKGSDVIYKKTLIRKSDKKEIVLRTISNLSGGFNHDDPYDCDFSIDSKKEDTIDPFNELDLEGKKVRKSAKLEADKKKKEEETAKALEVEFDLENPLIPPNEYRELCLRYLNLKTFQDLFDVVDNFSRPLAKKYNMDINSLHYPILHHNKKKDSLMKYILKYEKSYNKSNVITKVIPLKIQGQTLELSEKEARAVLKQLKYEV